MNQASEIPVENRSSRRFRSARTAFGVVLLAGVLGGLLFVLVRSLPKHTTASSPGLIRIALFSDERGAITGYEVNGRKSAPVGHLHEALDFDLAQIARDPGFHAAPEKEARFQVDERLLFGQWRQALNIAAKHLDAAPRVGRADPDPHPEGPFRPTKLTFETADGIFLIDYPWRHLPAAEKELNAPEFPAIQVRLKSVHGQFASLELGNRNLGNHEDSFVRLNGEILRLIGRPGNPLTRDFGLILFVPDDLPTRYAIAAFKACYGRLDPRTGTWVRYFYRIRFNGVPELEVADE